MQNSAQQQQLGQKQEHRYIQPDLLSDLKDYSPYRIDPKKLNRLLTGFWANNIWDLTLCPLIENFPDNNNRYIQFTCRQPSLNIELRYAYWTRYTKKKWRILSPEFSAQLHRLCRFLNEKAPKIESLLEYALKKWELMLKTYLIETEQFYTQKKRKLDGEQKRVEYNRGNRCLEIFRQVYRELQEAYDVREMWERDVWDLSQMAPRINEARSETKLNFRGFEPLWLRRAVQKYLRYFVATYSVSGCQVKMSSLRKFGQFLIEKYPHLQPDQIDREIILDYIAWLAASTLRNNKRRELLLSLRTFFEHCLVNDLLPLKTERLIFREDLPRLERPAPRFISEYVMQQLEEKLPLMKKQSVRRAVEILIETGARVSEVCTLKLDCLRQDAQGDYFLHYLQGKFLKEHVVPISRELAQAILAQKQAVTDSQIETEYLFPRGNGKPMKCQHIRVHLNEFAEQHQIKDENGKLWRFQPHQFRHTVGTRMINRNVPQYFVQRFLGHESPEMTSVYAQIHDQTLKEEFYKYQQKKRGDLIDIGGNILERAVASEELDSKLNDLEWFKVNIQAQALPNGYCRLPAKQSACPHSNACLTCASFATDSSFLPQHEAQLKQTVKLVQISRERGWTRQAEMNERVQANLETIVQKLKSESHGE